MSSLSAEPPFKMIVTVPVADLRGKPVATPEGLIVPALSRDIGYQESQLLMGSYILAEPAEEKGWLKVEALEQKRYKNDVWTGYPGFIQAHQACEVSTFPADNLVISSPRADVYTTKGDEDEKPVLSLSLGTRLSGKLTESNWWQVVLADGQKGFIKASQVRDITMLVDDINQLREDIVKAALLLVGNPYVWGTNSAYKLDLRGQLTGFDCSGLMFALFRSFGIAISRDAHDQYLVSDDIKSGEELKKGDLVFLALKSKPYRMYHVLMYIGDDTLIESTGSPFSLKKDAQDAGLFLGIRVITAEELLGTPIKLLMSGQECKGDKFVRFGTVLSRPETFQKRRDNFMHDYRS